LIVNVLVEPADRIVESHRSWTGGIYTRLLREVLVERPGYQLIAYKIGSDTRWREEWIQLPKVTRIDFGTVWPSEHVLEDLNYHPGPPPPRRRIVRPGAHVPVRHLDISAKLEALADGDDSELPMERFSRGTFAVVPLWK
jgi:hypothetical protein